MSLVELDHCVIHVSDWERSNAFYRDVLGAEVVPRGAGFAYRIGDIRLNCHGPGIGHVFARTRYSEIDQQRYNPSDGRNSRHYQHNRSKQ